MNIPMISLIIPIYNCEKYLAKCLNSIQQQTFPDFEVILVNDGSTDRSEEICREYVQKDSRFRLISGPNHGAAGARNIGLKAAEGAYIAFTDSDDWLEPDYLEYLYTGLMRSKADIFYCDYSINSQPEHGWQEAVFTGGEAVCELVSGGCCNRIHNKLYRRSCMSGIWFPEGRDLCEDAAWTPQVLEKAGIVARGPEAKYHIRLTENSLSRKKRHTEAQVCGFYRKLLERCTVLMRQYHTQQDYQENILAECRRCLEFVLESGCDLEIWGVYEAAKRLAELNRQVFSENGLVCSLYFLCSDDGRDCDRQFLREVLTSRHEPASRKAAVLKKHLLSVFRRMRK